MDAYYSVIDGHFIYGLYEARRRVAGWLVMTNCYKDALLLILEDFQRLEPIYFNLNRLFNPYQNGNMDHLKKYTNIGISRKF